MKKILITDTDSGVIGNISPVFSGPAVSVVYSKASGFQSINNDLFTINSGNGDITLNAPQAEGKYYLRYRVAKTNNLMDYLEDVLILNVSSETSPTGSVSNTYSDVTAPGDVVASVASTFPSPIYEMQYREAGSSPASELDSDKAFEIDTSGDIKWTGNVSSSTENNYKFLVSVRSAVGCFSASTEVEINYQPGADCPYPGTVSHIVCGYTAGCPNPTIYGSDQNDVQPLPVNSSRMATCRAEMEDFNGPTDSLPAGSLVEWRSNGVNTVVRIARSYLQWNFAGEVNPHIRLNVAIPGGATAWRPNIYLVYFNGVPPTPPLNNWGSPLSGWTKVKTISTAGQVAGTSILHDIKVDFATPGTSNIGVIIDADYDNDWSPMDTYTDIFTSGANANIANVYDCP